MRIVSVSRRSSRFRSEVVADDVANMMVVTWQVVSGLDRDIPAPNGAAIPGAIQTDAAINSGMKKWGSE